MYYNQSTVRKMYNILLVEDDKNIREMLVEYFSKRDKEKFNITLAENGLKGLDKAYENSYDLLLLDVMLPEMDGFTLCKEIRRYRMCRLCSSRQEQARLICSTVTLSAVTITL